MKQTRILDEGSAKLRTADDGRKVAGYASVWGVVDRHGTAFHRGAFGPDDTVPLVWNHNGETIPVGQVRVFDDEYGRAFEGELFVDDLGEARALAKLLHSGAVRDCSHGFVERMRPDAQGNYGPDSARIIEVSAAFPHTGSNQSAFIGARTSVSRAAWALEYIGQMRGMLESLQGLFDYGDGASEELETAVEGELAAVVKMLKSVTLKSKT